MRSCRFRPSNPKKISCCGLLASDRVLTHPGYFFDFTREAFLVVSLLLPPATFEDGVDRLFRHFDCNSPTGP